MTRVRRAIDLASARVLITNDDGIEAEGLRRLVEIVRPLTRETWICAPAEGHSGASAMVSLRREVTFEQRGKRAFAVGGRPADCIHAALQLAMPDNPPDLVLSGINHGVNIGGDLIYSGTVGAAMTGAFNGIPAVALSADHPPKMPVADDTWDAIADHLPDVLRTVLRLGFARGTVWGVNFPVTVTSPRPVLAYQGGTFDMMRFHPLDRAGRYIMHHQSPDREVSDYGGPDGPDGMSDFAAVRAGHITLTPLTIDRTDHALLREAAEAL